MSIRFSNEEFRALKNLLPIYQWGLKTLMTKLNILHEDLTGFQKNNAIEYIKSRIKAPESIAEKLHKLGVEVTAENAKKHLRDIAGVRIIVPFARDIYFLADIIRSMPGITVLVEKDFISSPKPSGYRSYHIIMEVPVFFSGKTENVTVEIQIRTEAMNFWATLEHKARYKYKERIPQHLSDELVVIADKISELDNRMFLIHEIISLINQDT
ncbi:MAG: GTP pyrophosphokinase family protein [Defluviitaleaceae bacterium]|nr:GTP pyrophosphokinase family protein [Defluviitaleaceae bacterium]